MTTDAKLHEESDRVACIYPRRGENAKAEPLKGRKAACLSVKEGTLRYIDRMIERGSEIVE